MLGPPGSGKGTQAALITQRCGIPTVSSGDALRAEMEAGTQLGSDARAYVEAGLLVPDDLVISFVSRLIEEIDSDKGFLLDGFPRTTEQAEALDDFLTEKGTRLDKVFYLRVPKKVLLERIAKRRACPECGVNYHISGRAPKEEGICDKCGTHLVVRRDDVPDTAERRIDVYNELTNPLVDYYTSRGILAEIDGTADVDTQHSQIVAVIKAT